MQREIKFRAYAQVGKSWIYWDVYGEYPQGIYGSLSEPQQYTGFKDHNGVEIYEGDYVLCHAGVPVEEWWKYEVKWKHGGLAAHCGDYVEPFHLRLYTVVGNIFEGVKNYEYRLEEPYHLTKITVKELTNERD